MVKGSISRIEGMPEEIAKEIGKILNWLENNSETNTGKLKQYLMSFETADELLVFFKSTKKQLGDAILEDRLLIQCNEVLREKFRKRICKIRWQGEEGFTLAFA